MKYTVERSKKKFALKELSTGDIKYQAGDLLTIHTMYGEKIYLVVRFPNQKILTFLNIRLSTIYTLDELIEEEVELYFEEYGAEYEENFPFAIIEPVIEVKYRT